MRSLHRFNVGVVLAFGAVFAAVPTDAALLSAPLSDLINSDEQIAIGDKIFENFEASPRLGIMPYSLDLANIQVTGIQDGANYGLSFTAVGGMAPIISAGAGGYLDLVIGFDARVTNAFNQISEVQLSFVPSAPSDGLAQIVESAYGGSDDPVLIQVSTLGSNTASAPLSDTYPTIRVYKDIAVIGGITQGTAITEFRQLFIQVPEPAAISLLALGSLVLLRGRVVRRRTIWAVAIVAGLAGVLIQPNTASAVLLSDLLANPSDTVPYGDFVFSNFAFQATHSGRYIADPTTIDVQGFTTPDGSEDGLRFVGLIAALSNVTPGSSVTINLDYDVTPNQGTPGISDVTMSFNGAPTHDDGSAVVTKTIFSGNVDVGGVTVRNGPKPLMDLQDHAPLTGGPYGSMLRVHDTITLEGGEAGATTISFINQTFSVEVPEPATVLLGLLGLPMLVRRRRVG
jgi:hypothetical protein